MSAISFRWMWSLWPAFLLACVAELLFFGLIDPGDLHWRGEPIGISRQAAYTIGFFLFWGLATASSMLTLLLAARPEPELRPPMD
ncbi:MAG: hypothetical protein KJ901_12250 [Gammaproteobacteria bacterium]|nr:hypothetical protein [Gammaproteobacteria bacterium]MBU1439869.1 hypothetical protein [Gammaproteobacteria bacterium]